jgi:hypothetical protein
MRSTFTRNRGVSALTLLGILAACGIAYAAIPSADGVIHSCYNAGSNPAGQLRVIDAEAGGKCSKNEKPLNWNATRPKGDTGAPGMSGYEIVRHQEDSIADTANQVKVFGAGVSCPSGKKAVGGGGSGDVVVNHFATDSAQLVDSHPFDHEGTSGWGVLFGKADGSFLEVGEGISITAYAVCVNVAN